MDKLGWTTKKGELLLALGRHEDAEKIYRCPPPPKPRGRITRSGAEKGATRYHFRMTMRKRSSLTRLRGVDVCGKGSWREALSRGGDKLDGWMFRG